MESVVELPSRTVTFLFSDVEGSSRLWDERPEERERFLARQEVVLREAVEGHGGRIFKSMGDAFCAAFPGPDAAVRAALQAQLALLVAEPGTSGGAPLTR